MKMTDFLRGMLVIGALYLALIAITLADSQFAAEASGRLLQGLGF